MVLNDAMASWALELAEAWPPGDGTTSPVLAGVVASHL
jgi:hypothetical protein